MSENHTVDGIVINAPVTDAYATILTPEALAFVQSLAQRFEPGVAFDEKAVAAASSLRERAEQLTLSDISPRALRLAEVKSEEPPGSVRPWFYSYPGRNFDSTLRLGSRIATSSDSGDLSLTAARSGPTSRPTEVRSELIRTWSSGSLVTACATLARNVTMAT